MRMHGHAAHDDMKYVPREQVEAWQRKDPIDRQAARLARARRRRRRAARGGPARRSTPPPRRRWPCRCPTRRRPPTACSTRATRTSARRRRRRLVRLRGGRGLMPAMTYLQAISDGLRKEMRDDERVLVMGEDIGVFGGAFKVTDGFIEEFGAERVMDTPLAESGIIGTAVGAAVVGMRPVCEMQFADFISCGFDQLVNVAGKMHYRQGLPVNHHGAAAQRRRLLRRPVPLAEPRGVVHARARAEGRRAVDGRGRQGAAHRRDPRPQPGRLPRAQAPLPPREGRGARRARTRRRSPRAWRARAPT